MYRRVISPAVVLLVVVASPAWSQTITTDGNIETDAQLVSKVATGTAPLVVSSKTKVPNFNADLVDGIDGLDLALAADLLNAETMLVGLQAQLNALGLALVPRSGQTDCYDTAGLPATCGVGIGLAQDGDLHLGVTWPNPRFTKNGNGTVTDNLTGLIWLESANCFGNKNWADALAAANGLFDGSINDPGRGDCGLLDNSIEGEWRVPNIMESLSLVHWGVEDPALPNTSGTGKWSVGDPFSEVPASAAYWSSTTTAMSTDHVWVKDISIGVVGLAGKWLELPLWPVRGGQH